MSKNKLKPLTFNHNHKVFIHPGGGEGKDFKPTHRIFLQGSPLPTQEVLEKFAELKDRISKIKFPFSYIPLDGKEV